MRFTLFHCVLMGLALVPLYGQNLEPDAHGCVDSAIVPKLPGCRIDNCEKKDVDHRDVATHEDEKGDAVTSAIEGESRSVMYECSEGSTPAGIVEQSIEALKEGQFEIPYRFSEKEGAITAKKGDLWVLIDAASRYYTLVELKATPPDESVNDAADMTEAIERKGHVALYGVTFPPGSADVTPASASMLLEIVAMMEDNPDWRIRVEGHTDSTGNKLANVTLSQRRSAAVVSWLVFHRIKRQRLESAGLGDAKPVVNEDNEAARAKNRRIELVKIEPLAQ
jgi:outer membrane protein OmpA-like peptidoglycan-associated protein